MGTQEEVAAAPAVKSKSKPKPKPKTRTKAKKPIASAEEIIAGLKAAIILEQTTGKAYRILQKTLSLAKKAGLTGIRCNSKKTILLAEARRLTK